MSNEIAQAFNAKLDIVARSSAAVLNWKIKAADLIAEAIHREYNEVAVPGIKATADDKLEAILAEMRAGESPILRHKKITEPALAELLGSPFGVQLATSVMRSIDRALMPVVTKARRNRDRKIQELAVLHSNENRSTSIYDVQARSKTAAEALAEIERRDSQFPAKKTKR